MHINTVVYGRLVLDLQKNHEANTELSYTLFHGLNIMLLPSLHVDVLALWCAGIRRWTL